MSYKHAFLLINILNALVCCNYFVHLLLYHKHAFLLINILNALVRCNYILRF